MFSWPPHPPPFQSSNLTEWIVESVGAGEVPGGVAGGRVAVVPEHAVLVNTTVRLS